MSSEISQQDVGSHSMRTSPDPLLSVVIVCWNQRDDLNRCVTSVLAHTRYEPMEVIVVDNGSNDGSVELMRQVPEVRLIVNPRNMGAGAARNQGMAAAQGDLVLILDCDTYVTDDVIGRTAAELVARPEISVLACELQFPDGRRQHSAQRAMSIRLTLLRDLWLYRLLPSARRPVVLLGGYYEGREDVDVDWLAGAFIMLRRSVLADAGGFAEDLFPEDSEWGIRVHRKGHRFLYAPRLGVTYHSGTTGVGADRRRILEMHHRAGMEAYRRLNGKWLAVCYWGASLLGAAVRFFVYRVASRLRRGNRFYAAQEEHYGMLVAIYLEARPFLPRRPV